MAVSKRLRYEVLRRDNHTCRYCGQHAPDVKLTVDHVIPTALGGSDLPENLVAACVDCNAGKSASSPDAPLVDDVARDALRWVAAMKRAAEIQASRLEESATFARAFYEHWITYTYGEEKHTLEEFLPNDWERTVDAWRRAGVTSDEGKYAIRVAMLNSKIKARDIWRYTCGVVWRQLDERQQLATQILAQSDSDPAPVQMSSVQLVAVARELLAEEPPYREPAPAGTHWVDNDLVDDATLQVLPYPKLMLLFHTAYEHASIAKECWADITPEEVIWGYPRYYTQLGNGIDHRLSSIVAEYGLSGDSLEETRAHLASLVAAGIAETETV